MTGESFLIPKQEVAESFWEYITMCSKLEDFFNKRRD